MDKFIAVAAVVAGVGAFLFSRSARASGSNDDLQEIVVNASKRESTQIPDSRPRGIRNNNPGNLEYIPSINWRGQLGSDGRYAVFDNAVNGIRALMIDIHTGFRRDGEDTVREIINEWAPHGENPTERYIQYVAERVGVAPDQPLIWASVIIPMAEAITAFENGYNPYPRSTFIQAFQATGKS